MKPQNELGKKFEIDPAAQESLREHQLYSALRETDGAFDTFTLIGTADSTLAQRLAKLEYNVDNLPGLDTRGKVLEVRISPAYDPYEPDETPGALVVSRCQRMKIQATKPLFGSRHAVLPTFTYYVFGIQPDLSSYHVADRAQDSVDSDSAPEEALILNQARFVRGPSMSAYRFGIVRRGDEVTCFRIEANPRKGSIIGQYAVDGTLSFGDERPQFGPIDKDDQKLTREPLTPELCGALLDELQTIRALDAPSSKQVRTRRALGKRAAQ